MELETSGTPEETQTSTDTSENQAATESTENTEATETSKPSVLDGEVPATEKTTEAKPEDGEPDYSFMPKLFLNEDGTPNVEKLATSYKELQATFSSGKRGSFAPKDVAEYEYENPEGFEIDEEVIAGFKAELKELNVSKEAFPKLMEKYVAESSRFAQETVERLFGTVESNVTALKEEWGDNFQDGIASANKAFNTLLPGHDRTDPIIQHPTVMKILAQIGNQLGEDTKPIGNGNGSKEVAGADEIMEIMKTKDWTDDKNSVAKVKAFYDKGGRLNI